jgi:hypothetical protein
VDDATKAFFCWRDDKEMILLLAAAMVDDDDKVRRTRSREAPRTAIMEEGAMTGKQQQ